MKTRIGRRHVLQWTLLVAYTIAIAGAAEKTEKAWQSSYRTWNLQTAVGILNDSPWAHRETFTRVIGGVGSGIRGEKEIHNTFYIRLLSARPIREAYARIRQLQEPLDRLGPAQRKALEKRIQDSVNLDVSEWIVITVGIRSNDPNQELQIRKFYETQTLDRLRNSAFLSTARFSQVAPLAYYPPENEGVGAKFIFPRQIDDSPVVSAEDSQFTFELDTPGADNRLRVIFNIPEMVIHQQLVY